jgi:hypothetical protein
MKKLFVTFVFLCVIASIARGEEEVQFSKTRAISDQDLKNFLSTQKKNTASTIASNQKAISPEDLNTLLSSSLNRPRLTAMQIQSLFTPQNVAGTPASTDKLLADAVERAKNAYASPPVKKGDPNLSYDVIIQMGHYKRTTGRTGTEGNRVTEQMMGAFVGTELIAKLAQLTVGHKPIELC